MKMTTLIVLAVALVLPLVGANPNAQFGEQTGREWSESTLVRTQGGTTFLLVGAIGDHDIAFYDANGFLTGYSVGCGSDTGTVPPGSVRADVLVWDHIGSLLPECGLAPADPLPSSWFVYIDGL